MKKFILTSTLLLCSVLLFGQNYKNTVKRSHLRFPGKVLSNICGYVDSLGNEYALVGTSTGMSIVNVSNPDVPFLVASFAGPNSIWREIKTWQHYAYVTTEGGGGLQIINLRDLPGTNLSFHSWTPTILGQTLGSIHALHIDAGYVYLYGSNVGAKGIIIGDLTDPYNPAFAGIYNTTYVHDGYVRNDTAWAGQIYAGTFAVIDLSNKATPFVINTQQTPNSFTHNTWLSDNSKYLFTTDEVDNSYLAAYDVSNANAIQFMDKIQSQNPGSQSIVHNTHILNDFAITSWYKDGFVITDCHRPQNLVNVGYADDCPLSGGGFDGVWGVYPFLPSGTIVTSDIDSGMYVYTPTYVRACYFEGVVRDSVCNNLINSVHVTIQGTSAIDSTDFTGNFKTGTPDSGTFTAVFSKAGYNTLTMPITLVNGQVTTVNVKLLSNNTVNLSGTTLDTANNVTLASTNVSVSNANSTYSFLTDAAGQYSNCLPIAGQLSFTTGLWGYETTCFDTVISAGTSNIDFYLNQKIADDFSFDYGWTVNSTSTTGAWIRAVPVGTTFSLPNDANPGNDASGDCTDKAFVTGNSGGSASADDVDNGATYLTSPFFDLSTYVQPIVHYSRWFFNAGGAGTPNDSLHILLNNGGSEVELETVTVNTPGNSSWISKSIDVTNLLTMTTAMQLRVITADVPPGHLVEAGFDNFYVTEGALSAPTLAAQKNLFTVLPNPSQNEFSLNYSGLTKAENLNVTVKDVYGKAVEHFILNQQQKKFGGNLSSGIYFVTVQDGNQTSTKKLVKY